MPEPIRRERTQEIDRESWEGEEFEAGHEDITHYITDNDGLDSIKTVYRRACPSCGTLATYKGFCCMCKKPACSECFGHCLDCSRPLCSNDSKFPRGFDHKEFRFCKQCYAKRRLRKLGRAAVSPFVEFTEDERVNESR